MYTSPKKPSRFLPASSIENAMSSTFQQMWRKQQIRLNCLERVSSAPNFWKKNWHQKSCAGVIKESQRKCLQLVKWCWNIYLIFQCPCAEMAVTDMQQQRFEWKQWKLFKSSDRRLLKDVSVQRNEDSRHCCIARISRSINDNKWIWTENIGC